MVKEYSLKKDGKTLLSPHFRVREFACPTIDRILIDERLPVLLEQLRERLSCSKIVITSGYRDPDYDRSRGGSGRGFHVAGQAVDVNCWHIVNGKEERYHGAAICCALQEMGVAGIGWIGGRAVHIDMREDRYWFDEQNGNRSIGNDWFAFDFGAKANAQKPVRTLAAPALQVRWDYRRDAAVRRLQTLLGVAADGKAGPDTYAAAKRYVVRRGERGEVVRWAQERLNAFGYACGTADGIAGNKTVAAIAAFHHAFGQPDGPLGDTDWYFLLR